MVLPNVLLFPNSLLPLFIFEPRYRAMLEWALAGHRMFCIALLKQGRDQWSSPEDFHHVAGLGLIRACVRHKDGSSHLILQGLARVEFTGFVQQDPFCVAEIRERPSAMAEEAEALALSARLRELCAEQRANGVPIPNSVEEQLTKVKNPAILADLIAHSFVRDPYRRQSILEEADVARRLRMLIQDLGRNGAA